MKRRPDTGSMLIELMIVLSVVAVLSGITLPWYGTYVRKTQVGAGLALSGPARARTEELVNTGQLIEDGIAAGGYWGCNDSSDSGANCSPTPGEYHSAWESVSTNPSAQVSSVVRVGTVVIVNFSSSFDPEPYSLVLNGSLADGQLTWQCMTGPSAKNILGAAKGAGAPTGKEIPADWAPVACAG